MNMNTLKIFTAAAMLAGVAQVAPAQDADAPVQSRMEAFVVEIDREGEEQLIPAQDVEPGQTVEWQIVYSNVTAKPQNNLVVTGPVPAGTAYVAQSAGSDTPASVQVSVDDGRTFATPPITREVRDESGAMVRQPVPATEYTHVRWQSQQPLRGFSNQTFTYRVTVE